MIKYEKFRDLLFAQHPTHTSAQSSPNAMTERFFHHLSSIFRNRPNLPHEDRQRLQQRALVKQQAQSAPIHSEEELQTHEPLSIRSRPRKSS